MQPLREYLNSLPPASQADFAARAGTSIGYLRNAISTGKKLGLELTVALEKNSNGAVTREQIRADVDWSQFERTGRKARARA